MIITQHDEGCFKIQTGGLSLVVDPLNVRLKPDILIRTSAPLSAEKPGDREVIGAGEYEIEDVSIKGVELVSESNYKIIKTVYAVKVEEISLGFMGELFSLPEPEIIESLGEIDILFLPVGGKSSSFGSDPKGLGKPYIEAEKAAKLVKQINPKIVIPCYTKNPKEFFEEMGQKVQPEEKLTIKKKELSEGPEITKVVWLNS